MRSYIITYSSLTGNTKIIAEAIKEALGETTCVYCGDIEGVKDCNAEVLFVGFWVNKGSCTNDVKEYLQSLENKKIALFGTAGFGGSKKYYETILENVKSNISKSNEIIGSFMCQGKMSENVFIRYSKMLEEQPENIEILGMIHNYNNALSHPDENDVSEAKAFSVAFLATSC